MYLSHSFCKRSVPYASVEKVGQKTLGNEFLTLTVLVRNESINSINEILEYRIKGIHFIFQTVKFRNKHSQIMATGTAGILV